MGTAAAATAATLALCLATAVVTATAELRHTGLYSSGGSKLYLGNLRNVRSIIGDGGSRPGCVHEGAWYGAGEEVATHEPCLRCTCAGGALQCRRRACAPLPHPPPPRCHTLHRRNKCCPELHCTDGVSTMELGASGRLENEDFVDPAANSALHECIEGGTVFAAGSAMWSRVPCEHCFCLRGRRRCVRPRCLPPPHGCRPRPAPGACCPDSYRCQHSPAASSTTPTATATATAAHATHDCLVDGRWIAEGERVSGGREGAGVREGGGETCTQCFCLRGSVHCQPLTCAPTLLGCRPLLRPGQCCPHHYHCQHTLHHDIEDIYNNTDTPNLQYITDHSILPNKNEYRSLHKSKSTKIDSSLSTTVTENQLSASKQTNNQPNTTIKVKRKTNDSTSEVTSHKPKQSTTTNTPTTTRTNKSTLKVSTTEKQIEFTKELETTGAIVSDEKDTTEQPEGTVKIMINGTINCTAELSSTSEPLNVTKTANGDSMVITQARLPTVNIERMDNMEDQTFNPNDIITDRSVNGAFDDNEVFTINVTSSLRANSTHSTPRPGSVISISAPNNLNISKKTKEDYDYDYNDATLPPSLPNLKIIPFVAADAVVDKDKPTKEAAPYPMQEREDKFPVYYANTEHKQTIFANRRQDVHYPPEYPIYSVENVEDTQFPSLTHDIDYPYTNVRNDLISSLGDADDSAPMSVGLSRLPVTAAPYTSTTFALETPLVNLFSPPAETEGGFIPKGPGIVGEYYAVYPGTPAPAEPSLTTSMMLDTHKGECRSSDGRRVADGDSVSVSCSVCVCAWGELRCSPRPCPAAPARCTRRPHSPGECCGQLVCEQENVTSTHSPSTTAVNLKHNVIHFTNKNDEESITIRTSTERDSLNNTPEIMMAHDNNDNEGPTNNTINITNATSDEHNISMVSYEPSHYFTEKPTSSSTPTTTHQNVTEPTSYQEYEEEEEDEGFSFGSVLKLLLSESYDSTTVPPFKSKTTTQFPTSQPTATRVAPTTMSTTTSTTTTTTSTTTTMRPTAKTPLVPFIGLPNIYPPSRKIPSKNVNRIDHLVLGELTSIRRPQTTSRPLTTASHRPVVQASPSRRPLVTTSRPPRPPDVRHSTTSVVTAPGGSAGGAAGGAAGGLLKLAGCNIYGRMYKVGNVIAELSSPCLECRCTDVGVQCRPLDCS